MSRCQRRREGRRRCGCGQKDLEYNFGPGIGVAGDQYTNHVFAGRGRWYLELRLERAIQTHTHIFQQRLAIPRRIHLRGAHEAISPHRHHDARHARWWHDFEQFDRRWRGARRRFLGRRSHREQQPGSQQQQGQKRCALSRIPYAAESNVCVPTFIHGLTHSFGDSGLTQPAPVHLDFLDTILTAASHIHAQLLGRRRTIFPYLKPPAAGGQISGNRHLIYAIGIGRR